MNEALALVDKYSELYTQKYKTGPQLNRYKAKWGMVDVIDSMGKKKAELILDYYFTLDKLGHPLTWFFYNFEILEQMYDEMLDDKALREKLRRESKERREKRINAVGSESSELNMSQ